MLVNPLFSASTSTVFIVNLTMYAVFEGTVKENEGGIRLQPKHFKDQGTLVPNLTLGTN